MPRDRIQRVFMRGSTSPKKLDYEMKTQLECGPMPNVMAALRI